jgi:tetratricopeptide (TPR) repeat protein
MAIDAYSQCPGATGKKIKFCCPDFLGELEKIDRMMEGEQHVACLQHIERLRQQPANSERQCLLAYQAMLLRATGQLEAAHTITAAFLEKYPANQAALAESAIQATMKNDYASAMNFLQHAFGETKGSWSWRIYQAAEMLVEAYFNQGRWVPARALLQFLHIVQKENRNVSQMLTDLLRSPSVPLLLKEDPKFPQPPENAPWANQFSQAISPMMYGDWRTTEANLAALVSDVSDSPAIWRSLATVRGWLGDSSGSIEALRKFDSFDIPLEDAAEAEATAMLLSDSPLGDAVPVVNVVWTVNDVEPLQEALLSDSRIQPIRFDPTALSSEDTPPPKAVCMIFDRPVVESIEGLTAQSMPILIGQLFLFGRQTDRDARLELIGVTAAEIPQIKTILNELVGQWLQNEETSETLTSTSATNDLLQPQWRPPMQLKPQQFHAMLDEYRRDALLNRWPEMKLGALDGLSPNQAAADAKYRVKLLAAILILQHYADNLRCSFDLNELRMKLGLPVLEPIDPLPGSINQLPLIRLARVSVDKLSDDELVQAFQRAVGYNHRTAVVKFGREIIDRPAFASRRERALAYITLARMDDDFDRALLYIEAGRKAADDPGKSNAIWDLEELSLRFARQEIPEALQLIKHIESTHINEANVSMVLTQILVDVGLLRPDGTPAIPTASQQAAMAGAGAAEAEPGKLWTPDSESAGGGGKLWVPE